MRKVLCILSILLMVSAFSQGAVALQLDSVSGFWTGTTGGTNVNGIGTNEVRWGIGADGGLQSGLRFVGSAPPAFALSINDSFDLGDLSHFNSPINAGTGASEAFLSIELSITNSSNVKETFDFTFGITETPNVGTPLEQADKIFFPTAFPEESFMLDGDLLTLELLGFGPSDSALIDQFVSLEGSTNTTQLWAQITQAPNNPVPEPTTVLLLGVGLAGLAGFRKKFRKG